MRKFQFCRARGQFSLCLLDPTARTEFENASLCVRFILRLVLIMCAREMFVIFSVYFPKIV